MDAFGFEPVEMSQWLQHLVPALLAGALPSCGGEGKAAVGTTAGLQANFNQNRPNSIHR
jgi:hypothetical protein